MKTIELGDIQLEACVAEAQGDQVVLTRDGRAVAVLIGVDGEQEQLGKSEQFWNLIAERRRQPTISRAELEQRLGATLVWTYSYNEWNEASELEEAAARTPPYPFGFGLEPLQILKQYLP